jgi:hypothetical protein
LPARLASTQASWSAFARANDSERSAAGYAGFLSSGELNKSWLQFLLCNFPHPSEHGMKIAIEKFKADHEFMRD